MNRENLFRAKSGQTWYYGGIHKSRFYFSKTSDDYNYRYYLVTETDEEYRVSPNTICQYTGLTDKNGTKIFEGDILQGDEYPYCSDGDYNYYAEVVWFDDGCCGFGLCTHKNPKSAVRGISDGNCEWFENFNSNNWSVVGNIYDNPELIEK